MLPCCGRFHTWGCYSGVIFVGWGTCESWRLRGSPRRGRPLKTKISETGSDECKELKSTLNSNPGDVFYVIHKYMCSMRMQSDTIQYYIIQSTTVFRNCPIRVFASPRVHHHRHRHHHARLRIHVEDSVRLQTRAKDYTLQYTIV